MDVGATSPATLTTRLASAQAAGRLEYQLDGPTGPLLDTTPTGPTGRWQSWTSRTVRTTGSATGVHRLSLLAAGGDGADLTHLNWFRFGH